MPKRRVFQVVAAAALAALPASARAVIFQGATRDPAANKVAPTGSLANSGWQWQFTYGSGAFTATPVGPHHVLIAKHTGGGVGSSFQYAPGQGANVTAVHDYGDDLRLLTTDATFYSYAPLYESSDEMNKYLVVHGRGGPRSTQEVHANQNSGNPPLGWEWSTNSADGPFSNGLHYWDGQLRWGQNKVSSTNANGSTLLGFDFTQGGDLTTGANEAGMVGGDSGGGVFINTGTGTEGEWRLAGINYSVNTTYRYSPTGADVYATVYNSTGLFGPTGLPTTGPTIGYASRVSAFIGSLPTDIGLPPTWKLTGSGTWNTVPGTWSYFNPTNAAGSTVDFRTAIQADSTVTLSAAKTVGTINFDNSHRYTLSGSSITFDNSGSASQINVASGSHTIASTTSLNNDLGVHVIASTSTLTISGAMTATGRTISKTGGGTVEFKNVRATGLNIQDGKVKILANSAETSKVSSLTIATNKTLDLSDNDLVVAGGQLGAWQGGSTYDGLTGKIDSGRNTGSWNGTGITSSIAGSTGGQRGLGIALASDALGFSSGTRSWSGQIVSSNDVLIKYTYVGDLDLNGVIDADDYWRIDSGYASNGKGYAKGDLDYSGAIDGDDYFAIDQNFSSQGGIVLGQPAGVTAVPEPSTLGVGCVFASALFARRRHRTIAPAHGASN